MKLTPLDIKKQEFKRTLRGYDPIEVDAFLEMVADQFENAIRDRVKLADEVLRLKTQLQDYAQVEKTLKETLVTAQENITVSRQNSKREADMVLRDAELRAEKIIEGARAKLEQLKNDILIIKAQKESFARRLRHLLESQIELLNVLEIDDTGYDSETDTGKENAQPTLGEGAGRRKVDISLNKTAKARFVRDASNRLARLEDESEGDEDASESEETPRKEEKLSRISDQFIT